MRLYSRTCLLVAVCAVFAGLAPRLVAQRDASLSNGLPLVPTRTIKFTTDEGSWMSVDVSPDGRTIAFDLLGDLYTMPIAGGRATPLTKGLAYDERPRYSADGRFVVFTSDRGGMPALWRIDADGRNARPLSATEAVGFALAPDMRRGNDTIRVGARSRDGRFAVVTSRTGKEQTGCPDSAVLSIRDTTQKSDRRLTTAGTDCWRGAMPASAFTPDNRELVTWYGGKIWRIDVQSGAKSQIPFTIDVEMALGPLATVEHRINDTSYTVRQIRYARPSPDGKRLAFTALDRLWIADLPDPATRKRAEDGSDRVAITNARRLTTTNTGERWPAWSPDGAWIAYAGWTDSDGGAGHLFRIRADGTGKPEMLTVEPGAYDRVNYTPDGKRITAVLRSIRDLRQRPGFVNNNANTRPGGELVWIPASGKIEVPITIAPQPPFAEMSTDATSQAQQYYGWAHFTNDATHLFRYETNHWAFGPRGAKLPAQRTDGIVSMAFDGSEKKVRARFETPNVTDFGIFTITRVVNEVLLSPTEHYALALVSQNKVYLVTLPPKPAAADTAVPVVTITDWGGGSVRRVTPMENGGSFLGWRRDGKAFYYSFGSSFYEYDIVRADSMVADSAARAARGERVMRAAYEPARTDIVLNVRRDRPSGTVALKGARLLTMTGAAGEVVDNGTIVVKDNRIVAVGPSESAAVRAASAGARVIDVAGKTILPGYVDLHDHILMNGPERTQVWNFLGNLAYGVTVGRDPQQLADAQPAYEDLSAVGWLLGPRYFNTGPGIAIPSADSIRGLDDARAVLRRYRDEYRVLTFKEYLAGDRRVRNWLIMAARELGMVSTSHADGGIAHALRFAQDGYPESDHGFNVQPLYRDVVQLLAQSQMVLANANGRGFRNVYGGQLDSPTVAKLRRFTPPAALALLLEQTLKPAADTASQAWRRESAAMAAIARAGGLIGVGQHGEIPGLGTQMEMWAYVDGGMPPLEALRAGTINGARVIGFGKDMGTLEVGKLADLQILNGNPLDNIRHTNSIKFVMKNGRLYDGDTLDEIWPQQRKLDPPWWSVTHP